MHKKRTLKSCVMHAHTGLMIMLLYVWLIESCRLTDKLHTVTDLVLRQPAANTDGSIEAVFL